MQKISLLSCIILLFLANPVHSEQIKDFIIEADKLSYSEDGTSVEAQGNVLATNKDLTIKSQNLVYYIDRGIINVIGGFEMIDEKGVLIRGDSMDYDLKERKGDAKYVGLIVQKTTMTGEEIKLEENEIDLLNSSFTGCDQEKPHYHITASRIVFYPQDGLLICYYGYFWYGDVPLVPFPVYIYDISGQATGGVGQLKNAPPVPEFGYNEEDGNYVIVRFPWYLNKKLNGNYLLSYADNNHGGGGIEANYIYDDKNNGNVRIYSDQRNNTYGGLTHIYSFGPVLEPGRKYFFGLFNVREKLLFDLITNFSYRERIISYDRVTVLPDVTLKVNDFPLNFDRLKLGGSVTYGIVSEELSDIISGESSIKTGRGIFITTLTYDIPTDLGLFGVQLSNNNSWYDDAHVSSDKWTRSSDLIYYQNKWGDIDGYLGHLHYMLYDGGSPFNYDMYHELYDERPSDEIYLRLGYNFLIHRIGIDYSYFVPSDFPKELDYVVTIGFHCYNIELKYRAMRKEFSAGFSLIER